MLKKNGQSIKKSFLAETTIIIKGLKAYSGIIIIEFLAFFVSNLTSIKGI